MERFTIFNGKIHELSMAIFNSQLLNYQFPDGEIRAEFHGQATSRQLRPRRKPSMAGSKEGLERENRDAR